MKKEFIKFYQMLIIMLILTSACKKDDDSSFNKSYNPSKPTELLDYYPKQGGIATKVILKGSNFDTNLKNLKVYFNKKRAAIVQSNGDMLYVLTPRQPGKICQIAVVNHSDSCIYNEKFNYSTQILVSTIAGIKGSSEIKDGTCAESNFSDPTYLCIDAEKNIFVAETNANTLRHINESKNIVYTIIEKNGCKNPMAPCVLPDQSILLPIKKADKFFQFDPNLQWSPKLIKFAIKQNTTPYDIDNKHSVALQKTTGYIFTRAYNGQLIKINPENNESELVDIDLLPGSESHLIFDVINEDLLYIAYTNKHCIYTYNLKTKEHIRFAGLQNTSGYADGERLFAKFNSPQQMCFDQDHILYIADEKNHCIRQIDENGIVSVVIGIPGMEGYLDGDPEVAMFENPCGVTIDTDGILYIADTNNQTIRKLSIQ